MPKDYGRKVKQPFNGTLDWQLHDLGYSIFRVAGDGNCMFRAMSDHLKHTTEQHGTIRKQVVDYMRKNSADFKDFVYTDYEAYMRRMENSGEWGGHMELTACSRLYNVVIVIHQFDNPFLTIYPTKYNKQTRVIHVVYDDDHYNSCRDIYNKEIVETVETCEMLKEGFTTKKEKTMSVQTACSIMMESANGGTVKMAKQVYYDCDNDLDAAIEVFTAQVQADQAERERRRALGLPEVDIKPESETEEPAIELPDHVKTEQSEDEEREEAKKKKGKKLSIAERKALKKAEKKGKVEPAVPEVTQNTHTNTEDIENYIKNVNISNIDEIKEKL